MFNKLCSKCKELKTSEYFHKDRSKKDGFRTTCISCDTKGMREKIRNGKVFKNNEIYYSENRGRILAHNKMYYEKNKEKIKKWRKEYCQKYYLDNKSKILKQTSEYRRQTKDNIKVKLRTNLRNRLYRALKGNCKKGSAVRDLGCSIADLKKWLEQQFYPHPKTGEMMTWDNYGYYGWHIDHIIPLSSFDLTDVVQIKKACHWFNLQPLWAEENLTKSNNIDGGYDCV